MGLSIGLKPVFRIRANDQDITSAVRDNLISLTLTDGAGTKSDTLTIALHDHQPGYQLPNSGAKLELWLGYDDQAKNMGVFIVSDIELSGPPSQMTIKALAAPLSSNSQNFGQLQTQKTRSWENVSLADMVRTIAGEQGLTPAVAERFSTVNIPHIDQTSESDINLLTRLAKDHDALVKPVSGRLLFTDKSKGKAVSGKSLPVINLVPADITQWKVSMADRSRYASVTTRWQDVDTGEEKTVTAGEGNPTLKITHPYPDRQAADTAAKSRYRSLRRGASRLSIICPGSPDLFAEGGLSLNGFRSGVDGEWVVTRVTHTLDGNAYRCTVEGESR